MKTGTNAVARAAARAQPIWLAVMTQLLFACALLWIAQQPAHGEAPAPEATESASAVADEARALLPYWFEAARRGDSILLQAFVDAGMPLDVGDAKGYTALILAAYNGQADAVRLLLEAGADACAQDRRGNTALMGAAFKGELSIARTLLAQDCADAGMTNHAGHTAVEFAAVFGRADVQRLLEHAGELDSDN